MITYNLQTRTMLNEIDRNINVVYVTTNFIEHYSCLDAHAKTYLDFIYEMSYDAIVNFQRCFAFQCECIN